mmetsp:Transcript_23099/g.58921  ORF Transcript_23099/g.58921 Transcript_23099/m.58921 type:complete len:494 (-) Transcript_23099:885-2366(-)
MHRLRMPLFLRCQLKPAVTSVETHSSCPGRLCTMALPHLDTVTCARGENAEHLAARLYGSLRACERLYDCPRAHTSVSVNCQLWGSGAARLSHRYTTQHHVCSTRRDGAFAKSATRSSCGSRCSLPSGLALGELGRHRETLDDPNECLPCHHGLALVQDVLRERLRSLWREGPLLALGADEVEQSVGLAGVLAFASDVEGDVHRDHQLVEEACHVLLDRLGCLAVEHSLDGIGPSQLHQAVGEQLRELVVVDAAVIVLVGCDHQVMDLPVRQPEFSLHETLVELDAVELAGAIGVKSSEDVHRHLGEPTLLLFGEGAKRRHLGHLGHPLALVPQSWVHQLRDQPRRWRHEAVDGDLAVVVDVRVGEYGLQLDGCEAEDIGGIGEGSLDRLERQSPLPLDVILVQVWEEIVSNVGPFGLQEAHLDRLDEVIVHQRRELVVLDGLRAILVYHHEHHLYLARCQLRRPQLHRLQAAHDLGTLEPAGVVLIKRAERV